jgi:hypothetical protein
MSEEKKVGEANAGFGPYGAKAPISLGEIGALQMREEMKRAERAEFTAKQRDALSMLIEWADAVGKVAAASAALKRSTAGTYAELWQLEHAAFKNEAAKRDALLAAADSLRPAGAGE